MRICSFRNLLIVFFSIAETCSWASNDSLFCEKINESSNFNGVKDSLIKKKNELQDSLDDLEEKKTRLIISSEYTNHVNFQGRDYGINQYGFSPELEFYLHSGLSFSLLEYYWSGLPNKFAKTDVGISYEKDITKNLNATIGYERWFLQNGNADERKELQNFTSLELSYDFDFITLNSSSYYMFGTDKIFITYLEPEADITFHNVLGAHKIVFSPSAQVIWGNNAVQVNAIGNISASMLVANKEPGNFFGVIDYELHLPLHYYINKTEFFAAINYAVPVHGSASDNLNPFFYMTAGIKVNLKTGK